MRFEPFPYQKEGFDFFMQIIKDEGEAGLLLAFDTGLGKTFSAIALGEELLERRLTKKVLLIVPANLKFQWAKALAKFTDLPTTQVKVKKELHTIPDSSACVLVDGTPEKRAAQYAAASAASVEYVIVGFDQAITESDQIRKLRPQFVVVDEASGLKNPMSKRSRTLKRKYGTLPYRLALTATPMENRPEEVFSLMQFVDERVLGNYEYFDKTYISRDVFGSVIRYKNLDVLHERLSTRMIRKTRHDPDVAPYMPDVHNEVWTVPVPADVWAAYKHILGDLLAAYDNMGSFGSFNVHSHYGKKASDPRGDKTALGRIMGIHATLQALLNHPDLVRESARLYETTEDRGNKYAYDLLSSGFELPRATPKLDFLMDEALDILDTGPSKILIFTKSKMMLRLMEKQFTDAHINVELYDGDMTVKAKEAAVTRFKEREDIRVLLSSHAGAYGTDLPEADWLINYDIPWGAGLATQINGRHVRASSEHELVHVIDMVCERTIEERVRDQKMFKLRAASAGIDGKTAPGASVINDVETLRAHATDVLTDTPGE